MSNSFGFNFDLTQLTNLGEIGDKLQRFKEDVETTIDASIRVQPAQNGQPSQSNSEQGFLEGFFDTEGITEIFSGLTAADEAPSQDDDDEDDDTDDHQQKEEADNHQQLQSPAATTTTATTPTCHIEDKVTTATRPSPSPNDDANDDGDDYEDMTLCGISATSDAARENTKVKHTPVVGDEDGNSREITSPPSVVNNEEAEGGGGVSTTSVLSSPLPTTTTATTIQKMGSTGSDRNMTSIIASYESRLKETNNLIATLKRERAAALKAGKNDKNTEATELLLKEKDEIIRQVMEEGEALSKKQLQQETVIKKLRVDVKKFKGEIKGLTDELTTQQEQTAVLIAAQEHHAHQLELERQQYEGLLKEALAAAKLAESKVSDSVKAGAARHLKDAESKRDALEANLSQLREELDQERAAADEREELLSREVAELQRRCSEAEARSQEAQARLPETAAPLMRQVEAMQTASQQQKQMWIEAEAALQSQVTAAKEAADALAQELNAAVEQVEQLTKQVEDNFQQAHAAQSQLTLLQQKLDGQMKKIQRLEDELQDTKAELRATRDAGAMLESGYSQQLEAAQAKDQENQNKINSLQQQILNSGQLAAATSKNNNNAMQPPALAGPGMKWVLVRETTSPMKREEDGEREEGMMVAGERLIFKSNNRNASIHADDQLLLSSGGGGGLTQQLVSLQRMVTDLTSTRDRLSEELVRAETAAAAGEASKKKIAQLEKRLQELAVRHSAAVELLGEREESLEELNADLAEFKQNFRHQIEFMADELQKYIKGASVS